MRKEVVFCIRILFFLVWVRLVVNWRSPPKHRWRLRKRRNNEETGNDIVLFYVWVRLVVNWCSLLGVFFSALITRTPELLTDVGNSDLETIYTYKWGTVRACLAINGWLLPRIPKKKKKNTGNSDQKKGVSLDLRVWGRRAWKHLVAFWVWVRPVVNCRSVTKRTKRFYY